MATNITVVKNSTGTFTIDTSAAQKALYPLVATLSINGTQAVTGVPATVLPYTTSLTTGVSELSLVLQSVSATNTEKLCYVNDDLMYCNILSRLAKLTKEEIAKDTTPYMYYLMIKGVDDTGCACSCDNIKTIYTNLVDIVNPSICC